MVYAHVQRECFLRITKEQMSEGGFVSTDLDLPAALRWTLMSVGTRCVMDTEIETWASWPTRFLAGGSG